MRLNVAFDYATVKNFESLEVAVGEVFTVTSDHPAELRWFFDNDPVVEASVNGTSAKITAKVEGTSTVLFLAKERNQFLHSFTKPVVEPVSFNPIVVDTLPK